MLLFTRSLHPQATIVSVDLDGYPVWRIPIYNRFALPGQTMHLLRADSHHPGTRAGVEEFLDGRKIDFLFIDGDHSDAGVRSDFELFYDLMRPGGLIGFHNIVDSSHLPGSSAVERAQNALLLEEIVADPNQRRRGIGLLHVERRRPPDNR